MKIGQLILEKEVLSIFFSKFEYGGHVEHVRWISQAFISPFHGFNIKFHFIGPRDLRIRDDKEGCPSMPIL